MATYVAAAVIEREGFRAVVGFEKRADYEKCASSGKYYFKIGDSTRECAVISHSMLDKALGSIEELSDLAETLFEEIMRIN